ncbi:hypothetical protein RYH73_21885 [Olivibacter sp. CPCC 100613]|uniref:hypothetical protein n=1 Tax=Olivibacter sp. CPCC 100613 TaxID=3079931 RepID=UPI002FFBFE13
MESILPIIIAAVVFGFQIYTNFKKEQEKARKRTPSHRPQPDETTTYKPLRQEVLQEGSIQEYKEVLKKQVPFEDYTGVIEVEEVKRTKEIHKKHPHVYRRLEPYKIDSAEEEANPYADFDLRDAVIKSAILNRPSY